jgi:hypothetical protein
MALLYRRHVCRHRAQPQLTACRPSAGSLARGRQSQKSHPANISHWPHQQIEALGQVLKGNTTVGPRLQDAFAVVRSLPHGHVATVLGIMRQLKGRSPLTIPRDGKLQPAGLG